jgi:hypothetical protein
MKNKGVWIVVIFFIVFILFMYANTQGLKAYRVKVCMEYQGREECRTASGDTKEHALRTATDNACALIASGMTDSIACTNTVPKKITWLENK